MIFRELEIKRSPELSLVNTFLPWEVEIVMAIHPQGQVQVLREVNVPDYEPVSESVEAEYNRLVNRFGQDSDSKIPFVSTVYGQGREGLAALSRAMDLAEEEARPLSAEELAEKAAKEAKDAEIVAEAARLRAEEAAAAVAAAAPVAAEPVAAEADPLLA